MKILQVCAVDFTLYHFLVPLVRAMEDAGHEVVVACADGPDAARAREMGIRVEAVPFARSLFSPRRHWRAYRAVRALLRREHFDIVHVHTPIAALIGRLAAWRAGVRRIVYTAHGFYFHEHMPAWKRRLFIAVEWIGGRVTDVLFTQAEEDAEAARRLNLCRGGVIEPIGNGVDPTRFHPADDATARAAMRDALDTPPDSVVIAVVARLVVEKGYLDLLAAMRNVDAILWVIGERLVTDHAQDAGTAIDAARDDPVLGPRLRLLGQRTDVAALLRAADVFTLPSHREGMPRSIIEAMMSGLPVVATDIRGSREEVVDGETGLLVPMGDPVALGNALSTLVGDPALRARFAAAGRDRAVANYDESLVIARQLRLLGLVPTQADA
jgi:glycosyltransferase involved in cell wall biosynthesis